ncbi:MAG TPA: MutH/Sau3AI family endonuclease [Polyangia bacterium]
MNGPAAEDAGPEAAAKLLRHARALVGVTLAELADALGVAVPVGNVRTKGWSGQIIERELGAGDGGEKGPDFGALGIELKTVPVTRDLVPLESTAVCQIDPIAIAAESWASSYVREKLARVLFIALSVDDRRAPVADRRVAAATLWTPTQEEEALLAADFEHFVTNFFRTGRAAEITGHQGRVLQVRPKGKNADDVRRAYGPDGQPVRIGKCGFYLRPGFVGRILRNAAMLRAI